MNKKQGDLAWYVMATSILCYDLFAIKTQKVETMSSALWRSLMHPVKSPVIWLSWATLTYHLFASKNARDSLSVLIQKTFNKEN